MSYLARLLRRTCSATAAATTTSAAPTEASIVRSLSNDVSKEGNVNRLVEKLKNASENEMFRNKTAIYEDNVGRLAAAKKIGYQDMSKEGFNSSLIALYGSSGMFGNARKVLSASPSLPYPLKFDSKSYHSLRPLSPHLPVYSPQLNSTVSIFNRISGAFLSAIILFFYLLYLKMPLVCFTYVSFHQFFFYSSKLILSGVDITAALALSYHLFYGVRHLLKH